MTCSAGPKFWARAAGDVHAFNDEVEHNQGNLRSHRRELLQQCEQFFRLRLAYAGAPVGIADDEVCTAANNVVLR